MATAPDLTDVQPLGFFTERLADADPGATNDDAVLGRAAGDFLGKLEAKLRIIDALGTIGAEVDHIMPGLAQPGDELVLQNVTGMIGGKGDAHGYPLGQASGIRYRRLGEEAQPLNHFCADARRCGQPGQQQGRRFPASTSFCRRARWASRVSCFLGEVIQQIHSLRASGVKPFYLAESDGSRSRTAFKSPGVPCRKSGDASATAGSGRLDGLDLEPVPDFDESSRQLGHHGFAVGRAGREAEAFSAAGNGREINRLDVEAVLGEQDIADPLGFDRAADEQRHDVGHTIHHRQADVTKAGLEAGGARLLGEAFLVGLLEVADRGEGAGGQGGR